MKEGLTKQFNRKIKEPISRKTEELEGQATQKGNEYSGKAQEKGNEYSGKAQETAWKSVDYYHKQDAFYRGLFWICVVLLIILWIVSEG